MTSRDDLIREGMAPANWYDAYHVVREDVVIDVWPITPRGPGQHGLSR